MRRQFEVDRFAQEILVDLVAGATASQRLRRAAQFRWAAPKAGDFTGRASRAQLREAHRRCHTIADALENSARIAPIRDDLESAIDDVWGEGGAA